jgi:WhiB family redox-sensing transcriptional regulator
MKFPDLSDAACKEVGTEFYYPESKGAGNTTEDRIARKICAGCPVLDLCREWGLHHERHGVWGGLSESDRRIERRKRKIIFSEVLPKDFL